MYRSLHIIACLINKVSTNEFLHMIIPTLSRRTTAHLKGPRGANMISISLTHDRYIKMFFRFSLSSNFYFILSSKSTIMFLLLGAIIFSFDIFSLKNVRNSNIHIILAII